MSLPPSRILADKPPGKYSRPVVLGGITTSHLMVLPSTFQFEVMGPYDESYVALALPAWHRIAGATGCDGSPDLRPIRRCRRRNDKATRPPLRRHSDCRNSSKDRPSSDRRSSAPT